MKKCIFIVFMVLFCSNSIAQLKCNDAILLHFEKFIDSNFYKHFNTGKNTQSLKNNFKSANGDDLAWKWDTIRAYDTQDSNLFRYSQTFDITGNVLYQLIEKWQSNTWMNDERLAFTYDNSGNVIIEVYEKWKTNAWVNVERHTYTYDSSGNALTDLREQWQSNAWINFERTTYTYDDNGNKVFEFWEEWQNNAWENSGRCTYTYDNNGNMLVWFWELWQNTWVNAGKQTYTYDNSGNMLTVLWEEWLFNSWVNLQRFSHTYDNFGNLLTGLWEQWESNAWVNYERYSFTYDGNNNLLTGIWEWWQNVWKKSRRLDYTYDDNGNSITGKCWQWFNNSWIRQLGSLELFSSKEPVYYLRDICRFEASFVSFSKGIVEEDDFNIFPNPASTQITIRLPQSFQSAKTTAYIYNIQGQLLMQQALRQEKSELNVSSLAKGMYIVKVSSDKAVEVGRFVKE